VGRAPPGSRLGTSRLGLWRSAVPSPYCSARSRSRPRNLTSCGSVLPHSLGSICADDHAQGYLFLIGSCVSLLSVVPPSHAIHQLTARNRLATASIILCLVLPSFINAVREQGGIPEVLERLHFFAEMNWMRTVFRIAYSISFVCLLAQVYRPLRFDSSLYPSTSSRPASGSTITHSGATSSTSSGNSPSSHRPVSAKS